MTILQNDKRYVAGVMRRILKQQVSDSSMNPDTVSAIFERGLLRKVTWPAWCITLTDAGSEYLREADEEPSARR